MTCQYTLIVPSHDYIATWLAVTHEGATPVPCEPDPETYNLAPDKIAALITPDLRVSMETAVPEAPPRVSGLPLTLRSFGS